MKNSSTHELISDLPDLNDGEKHNAKNKESNVNDTQNNQVSMACVADKKVIKINLHCFLKHLHEPCSFYFRIQQKLKM